MVFHHQKFRLISFNLKYKVCVRKCVVTMTTLAVSFYVGSVFIQECGATSAISPPSLLCENSIARAYIHITESSRFPTTT